jgi:NHLM bacteriocin system ABC transporter peptidase/ATP-binding protein
MVLAHHGRWVPLAELRRECGVTRDGSQASNVVKAAANYGLVARGFKKSLQSVQLLQPPFIIFWNFAHFVVVDGFENDRVYINDPSSGPRSVTLTEFSESFTGIALTFEPGPQFRRGGAKPSAVRALVERLRGSVAALAYCVLAGLLLVIPALVVAALTRAFVDDVLVRGMGDWLRPIVVAMFTVAIVQGALATLQLGGLRRLQLKLSIVTASRFLWHVLWLPASFYAQRYAGEVSSRVSLNDKVASVLSGRLATAAIGVTMVVFYGVAMAQYDLLLTALGVCCAVTSLVALRWLGASRTDASRRLQRAQGKADGYSISGLLGLETIKASALESDFFARWAGYSAKAVAAQQQLTLSGQLLVVLPSFLTALTTTAVLVLGGLRVMNGALTLGELTAFQGLMTSFLAPITVLVGLGTTIQELRADVDRLDDVLQNPAEQTLDVSQRGDSDDTRRLNGRVEVRDLTFGYNRVGAPLVEHLSFVAEAGERIAIVGASGSGKSTVLRLLAGLYEPWSGEILLDGEARAHVPHSVLIESIAIVEQDPVLFAGTVRENLSLWDESVPHDSLVRACVDAHVHDVVMALRGGYDGRVEEGASNLSGGQRQRVEIARALVNDPSIVLIDEATSALDPESESAVLQNLRRRGVTFISAAHRLSAIRDCDRILVLRQGKLVQCGTHESLIAEGGEYARLIATEGDAL